MPIAMHSLEQPGLPERQAHRTGGASLFTCYEDDMSAPPTSRDAISKVYDELIDRASDKTDAIQALHLM